MYLTVDQLRTIQKALIDLDMDDSLDSDEIVLLELIEKELEAYE